MSVPGRTHENRFFGLLAGALELEGVTPVTPSLRNTITFAYDVLHLNFPTHYVTQYNGLTASLLAVLQALYLSIARMLGRRIVYTVHDVMPLTTNHVRLSRIMLHLTHHLTNAFIFLSESSRAEFVRIYPRNAATRWILTPLGPYPAMRLAAAERRERRQALGVGDEDILLGFLGAIKPYKNIGALAHIPQHLADGRVVRTVVAGRVEDGHHDAVDAVLSQRPAGAVIRIDERLDDTRLDALMQAADFVLAPYALGSNSGVAMLALGNRARLIGSDLPIFRELATTIRPPWAYIFSTDDASDASLQATIEQAVSRPITDDDVDHLNRMLATRSYGAAAKAIKTLVEAL